MTVTVVFDRSDYIPLPTVSFSPPVIPDVQCDAGGFVGFMGGADCLSTSHNVGNGGGFITFTGSADCVITNPTQAITVTFASANYIPLPVVTFGVISTGLQCDAGGFVGFMGGADCLSTSHNVGNGGGVVSFAGGAACNSIVNIANGGGLISFAGGAACHYDINVKRYLTCAINVQNQNALCITRDTHSSQQAPLFQQQCITADVQSAGHVDMPINSNVNPILTLNTYTLVNQDNAQLIDNTLASVINLTQLLYLALGDNKQDATLINAGWLSVQDVLDFLISPTISRVENCHDYSLHSLKPIYQALVNYVPIGVVNFTRSDYVPIGTVTFNNSALVELLQEITRGLVAGTHSASSHSEFFRRKVCTRLQQARPPMFGKSQRVDLPRPPAPPQPPTHQTILIPLREAYTVQHSITVVNQAGTSIPLSKIGLSFDVDSYAWQFSGVLADEAALADVNMTGNTPEQLTITINGSVWVMLVESIEQSKSFGKTAISLKGRSLSALLGAPYQLQGSYTAGSDLTVQQIANALIPFDWICDWQCPVWLVPANAYSHTQQTTLQALASIAGFIGASLIPSRAEKMIKIQPRYPVLPWNFNAAGITPDLIVPESAIITVNTQSRTQSPIDGVYVHGGAIGGSLAWCRLNGTAGDTLAPTNSNSLITDVTACRALGERILAGAATQPMISSFTLPLGGDFVLAEVGQLVEVMGESGIINSVSIGVEFGKVSQTITIGENTSNAYSKLTALLPHYPLLVGTLSAIYGDGMAILTLLGGGVITARGAGVVGQNYYVRNGLIESSAPNLTPEEIVI